MPIFDDFFKNLGNVGKLTERSRSNKNIYLKDSRLAANHFSFGNTSLDNRLPRHKFLYFVNFVTSRPEITKRYNSFSEGISLLVKNFSKPGFSIRTETLNQYNKKRVVQSGIEYDQMNITFYNTYDKKVVDTINDYVKFYYGSFSAKNSTSWINDIIAPIFQYLNGEDPRNGIDWGYIFSPPISKTRNNKIYDVSDSYFFSEISLFQFGGNYLDKFTFVNPKITKVSFENEDYSDGATPDTISVSFVFEGMIMRENFDGKTSKRISQEESEAFGFNFSNFNNVNFPCYNNSVDNSKIDWLNNNFSKNSVQTKSNRIEKEQVINSNNSPVSNSSISKNVSPSWFDNLFNQSKKSSTSSVGFNMYSVFNPDTNNKFSALL